MSNMKKNQTAIIIIIILIVALAFPGCNLVREGITGEGPEEAAAAAEAEQAEPAVPPAFPIIGDWFGVYNDTEYLMLRFTANGKCELQPAVYPSDMFGPRYFGEYKWGGEGGKEVIMDMYKGLSREVDYGDGFVWDEYFDGGRENATTALMMTFRVIGGGERSFAVKAVGAGIDTEGYTVVQASAFVVLLGESKGGSGNPSPFLFGTIPLDPTEGKNGNSVIPDKLADRAERFYTTDELNVRCGPSTDYKTFGTVPAGTPVFKIGAMTGKEEWAFVLLTDGGGWVHTDYLSATKPEVKPVEPDTEEAEDPDAENPE